MVLFISPYLCLFLFLNSYLIFTVFKLAAVILGSGDGSMIWTGGIGVGFGIFL